MVRNVLEIMSFGKMKIDNKEIYSFRDLKNNNYLELFKGDKVRCGWLFYDEDGLKIEDCGNPYRISYDSIDNYFDIDFKEKFMEGNFDNAKSPYKKASEKYKLIPQDLFNNIYSFSKPYIDSAGRKIVEFDANGEIKGKIVMTGHPSPRKEPNNSPASGKIYDFVFAKLDNPTIYKVKDKVFENFKFAYFDGRKTQPKESEDWTFWKEKLYKGKKIPVFFHIGKDEDDKISVTSFGLSYLYKFPYKYSIMQAILENHTSPNLDLAQTIFGFIDKKDKKSLKGRIQFSHFKAQNEQTDTPRNLILGTPKASYYPIYLVQNGGVYKTLMDKNVLLAGWKRYPIHRTFEYKNERESTQTTKLTPLKEGAVFKGKLRYHNLKKVELGAILSALTFHNTPNTYHNIGLAKPYGYGKIEIKIENINIDEYLKEFEKLMFYHIPNWHTSPQLIELVTMATEQNNIGESELKYMQLKEFAKKKNDKLYLKRYTELEGINRVIPNSLLNEKEKLEIQKIKEHNNEWQIVKATDNIQVIENFINKYNDYSEHIEEAKQKLQQLKEQQEQEKLQKIEQEIEEKWNSIQKLDKRLQKSAIEAFLKKYPNSKFNQEANKLLDELSTPTTTKKGIEELSVVKDSKQFKKILDDNKENLNENKELIKQNAIRISDSLKGKKQKNFFKEIQLARFLGKDFEEEVKNSI